MPAVLGLDQIGVPLPAGGVGGPVQEGLHIAGGGGDVGDQTAVLGGAGVVAVGRDQGGEGALGGLAGFPLLEKLGGLLFRLIVLLLGGSFTGAGAARPDQEMAHVVGGLLVPEAVLKDGHIVVTGGAGVVLSQGDVSGTAGGVQQPVGVGGIAHVSSHGSLGDGGHPGPEKGDRGCRSGTGGHRECEHPRRHQGGHTGQGAVY